MTHQQLWFRHETLLRRAVVAAGADPGIWVVSAWSFHTIHFWPTGYTSSSVPRISTAHSPQPAGLYGSDRHSIGLLPKRFISKQSPCGCVLRIVELTLIRSELSSLDMP